MSKIAKRRRRLTRSGTEGCTHMATVGVKGLKRPSHSVGRRLHIKDSEVRKVPERLVNPFGRSSDKKFVALGARLFESPHKRSPWDIPRRCVNDTATNRVAAYLRAYIHPYPTGTHLPAHLSSYLTAGSIFHSHKRNCFRFRIGISLSRCTVYVLLILNIRRYS